MIGRPSTRAAVRGVVPLVLLVLLLTHAQARAQQVITQSQQTIRIERGKSALLRLNQAATRIVLGDPSIVNFELPDPRELILTALAAGSTNLMIWQTDGSAIFYTVEVAPEIGPLEDQIRTLFAGTNITVTTSGNAVVLSGAVRDPGIVRRVLELAQATGAPIINNIQAPTAEQVLLHVRFAEIDKSALSNLGANLFVENLGNIDNVVGEGQRTNVETLSEGIVRLFLIGQEARLDAIINALRSRGEFRSLAEPNLIAQHGQEATFLAGGEFPYPSVQSGAGGAGVGAVTIQFREFGVRLRFTPRVTPSGTIQLRVAPEVSSLDFGNGLTISGFAVPALLTRRAETQVELGPGQHLAIAGLLNNTQSETVDKIPLLGDLPILGALFRSKAHQQDRTELLVLVTPHIVEPTNVAPQLPPGEPGTWKWERHMRPDSVNRTLPQIRRGGNSP